MKVNLRQGGFTLIELLLAIAILTSMVAVTAAIVARAVNAKTRLQGQIDSMSAVRDALRIIERDVQLAFHYQDPQLDFFRSLRGAKLTQAQPGATPQPPPDPNNPPASAAAATNPFAQVPDLTQDTNRISPRTFFVGGEQEMSFVTSNVPWMSSDNYMADFVEVGYRLRSCKRPGSEESSTCLVRRLSTLVDTKVTEGGDETVLLEGVTEFSLRYIGKDLPDWVQAWNGVSGDPNVRNRFPELVEVSLSVRHVSRGVPRNISMQIIAAPRLVNNPSSTDPQTGTSPSGPSSSTPDSNPLGGGR